MGNTINKRIKMLFEISKERSIRSYALKIGVQPTTLSNCIKGSEPRFTLLRAILDREPSISAEWLLRGVGNIKKMEKTSVAVEELKAEINQLKGENNILREQMGLGERKDKNAS
ncbi:XRE family transcriptional regulator [Bacteroides reticulotermitis]|uniref:XRE family transcriptional regulator n=1 Tax=Bacteroides reticulotermitis TaxID=1133319 RepID=UPI003A8932A4